ncbi:unnamed protein product [Acanthoscelides obtectus]|nr:unnamed protein product [Acanthoscelides obtectus]CAK1651228.1 hypothetical protein AOBTE_LOCUS17126 [Acanthoscelides obtectus]
MYTCICV